MDEMLQYLGVKIIKAVEMTAGEAIERLGERRGVSEKSIYDEGYLVEYEDGYQSWSPKDVFDAAYRRCDAMTFGLALEAMKKGLKVGRGGWKKGNYIVLDAGIFHKVTTGENYPWNPDHGDVMAEDWQIVE